MKRIVAIALSALMLIALAACSSPSPAAPSGFEIALITDIGTIDDKSFNQGAWEGVVKYVGESNKTSKYYPPTEQSDDAYLAAIDLAVKGGAKVIVTPGYMFEVPIYLAQDKYPDVNFILLDGAPHNVDYSDFKTGTNTVAVMYAEEQAGFLAGYAAVKDGYRKLGYIGGVAVPAVVKFGHGYVQGAEYAAKELGLAAGDVTVNYDYSDVFLATPEVQTLAASWYSSGVEVIFACGGKLGDSVMAAAEAAGKKVIGVDIDQSKDSETVITSAMKGLTPSVYDCLKDIYSGTFKSGQTLIFNAANQGVGLPMATSKFTSFTQADYDKIFDLLVKGSITILKDVDDKNEKIELSSIPVSIVTVTEIR